MCENIEKNISQEQARALKTTVSTMAVESWRLFKVLEKLLSSLDVKEQQKYHSKIRWFIKKTEEALKSAGLSIVNYEGQNYDPGIPAVAINIEDFNPEEKLYVLQMLEPVIIDEQGRIIKTGTVSLGRME